MIRKSNLEDIEQILLILNGAIDNFKKLGVDQWQNGYPNKDVLINDIKNDFLYVYEEENKVLGFMAYIKCNEPNYLVLDNYFSNHSVVIHRIAVDKDYLNKGIATKMFSYVISDAKSKGFDSVKIDTHHDNYKMQSLIRNKFKFEYKGYLPLINRDAFELVIK